MVRGMEATNEFMPRIFPRLPVPLPPVHSENESFLRESGSEDGLEGLREDGADALEAG